MHIILKYCKCIKEKSCYLILKRGVHTKYCKLGNSFIWSIEYKRVNLLLINLLHSKVCGNMQKSYINYTNQKFIYELLLSLNLYIAATQVFFF